MSQICALISRPMKFVKKRTNDAGDILEYVVAFFLKRMPVGKRCKYLQQEEIVVIIANQEIEQEIVKEKNFSFQNDGCKSSTKESK